MINWLWRQHGRVLNMYYLILVVAMRNKLWCICVNIIELILYFHS